ncbi:hypothetical protein Daus18300_010510 [Diaporthe australafricana]|uniref:MYND-type domain-containing protein n=1 Tax=Diaporthe australafricana TaxID=127596 RepID=A0ABR3WA31_9PEZI
MSEPDETAAERLSIQILRDTYDKKHTAARNLFYAGQLEHAITALTRILEGEKRELPDDHDRIATTLYKLGQVYLCDGKLEKASYHLKQALWIRVRKLQSLAQSEDTKEEESEEMFVARRAVAISTDSMAGLYEQVGNFVAAKTIREEGLKYDRAICGSSECAGPVMLDPKSYKGCGQCEAVFYCSRECQVEDWTKRHKRLCQRNSELKKAGAFDKAGDLKSAGELEKLLKAGALKKAREADSSATDSKPVPALHAVTFDSHAQGLEPETDDRSGLEALARACEVHSALDDKEMESEKAEPLKERDEKPDAEEGSARSWPTVPQIVNTPQQEDSIDEGRPEDLVTDAQAREQPDPKGHKTSIAERIKALEDETAKHQARRQALLSKIDGKTTLEIQQLLDPTGHKKPLAEKIKALQDETARRQARRQALLSNINGKALESVKEQDDKPDPGEGSARSQPDLKCQVTSIAAGFKAHADENARLKAQMLALTTETRENAKKVEESRRIRDQLMAQVLAHKSKRQGKALESEKKTDPTNSLSRSIGPLESDKEQDNKPDPGEGSTRSQPDPTEGEGSRLPVPTITTTPPPEDKGETGIPLTKEEANEQPNSQDHQEPKSSKEEEEQRALESDPGKESGGSRPPEKARKQPNSQDHQESQSSKQEAREQPGSQGHQESQSSKKKGKMKAKPDKPDRSRLHCNTCGAKGHDDESCWKAHPERVPETLWKSHNPPVTRKAGSSSKSDSKKEQTYPPDSTDKSRPDNLERTKPEAQADPAEEVKRQDRTGGPPPAEVVADPPDSAQESRPGDLGHNQSETSPGPNTKVEHQDGSGGPPPPPEVVVDPPDSTPESRPGDVGHIQPETSTGPAAEVEHQDETGSSRQPPGIAVQPSDSTVESRPDNPGHVEPEATSAPAAKVKPQEENEGLKTPPPGDDTDVSSHTMGNSSPSEVTRDQPADDQTARHRVDYEDANTWGFWRRFHVWNQTGALWAPSGRTMYWYCDDDCVCVDWEGDGKPPGH